MNYRQVEKVLSDNGFKRKKTKEEVIESFPKSAELNLEWQPSTLDQEPAYSVRNTDGIFSTLSLQERLIELENQGIWISAKDPDTRITVGKPAPGALERFLADR